MPPSPFCPECGAALAHDAVRCDLCGTAVVPSEPAEAPDSLTEARPAAAKLTESAPPPLPPANAAGGVCTACGHANPPEARFCNHCGAPLAAEEKPAQPAAVVAAPGPVEAPPRERPAERASSEPGRQALKLVGLGVLAVLALYAVTQWSQGSAPDAPPAATQATPPTPSGPAPSAALPDSLSDRIAALEDEGTAESWAEAGRLLFQAALAAPSAEARAGAAQRAVDAFDQSLALREDLDVRTNLAAAALYDPRAPMRAVQELQQVLGEDPNHTEANFNMGLLRMQIGRLDGAAESFRTVLAQSDPASQVHQEAQRALAAVEQEMASGGAVSG